MKMASSLLRILRATQGNTRREDFEVAWPAGPDKLRHDAKAAADQYRAPALDKGLDILELLSGAPAGLTRAEIVRELGRSQSEIYRMLERLVARHYVRRSLEGDRYSLSYKLFA